MKIKEVFSTLEQFASLPLQEGYDNAGLQIGLTGMDVSGVLLCLDVTEAVLDEAIQKGCNLVISHHPLLFRGLKCIADADMIQRCVRKAILNSITIYAAHTNLDNAYGGVNFEIAKRLELINVRFLSPMDGVNGGSGVIGELPQAVSATQFLTNVKTAFDVECLMHNELLERSIRTVALCGGAGDFLLDKAISCGADAFLTGEMHYHLYFGQEQRIQIGVMGHFQSERYTVDLLHDIIKTAFPELSVSETSIHTNPIKYL